MNAKKSIKCTKDATRLVESAGKNVSITRGTLCSDEKCKYWKLKYEFSEVKNANMENARRPTNLQICIK